MLDTMCTAVVASSVIRASFFSCAVQNVCHSSGRQRTRTESQAHVRAQHAMETPSSGSCVAVTACWCMHSVAVVLDAGKLRSHMRLHALFKIV
jgi:hypothetical protein